MATVGVKGLTAWRLRCAILWRISTSNFHNRLPSLELLFMEPNLYILDLSEYHWSICPSGGFMHWFDHLTANLYRSAASGKINYISFLASRKRIVIFTWWFLSFISTADTYYLTISCLVRFLVLDLTSSTAALRRRPMYSDDITSMQCEHCFNRRLRCIGYSL